MQVVPLSADRAADVIDVFCESFAGYPVMRHVLGPADDPDGRRLRTLIELFVMTRVHRREPMFGLEEGGRLVGAATTTLPGPGEMPSPVLAQRERTWAALGGDARERYDEYARAAGALGVSEPHHHLNMIGIRASHAGRGHARTLIDAVHGLALADPGSAGVSLTTELFKNVTLYQHLDYQVVGHTVISPTLQTWSLFRPLPTED